MNTKDQPALKSATPFIVLFLMSTASIHPFLSIWSTLAMINNIIFMQAESRMPDVESTQGILRLCGLMTMKKMGKQSRETRSMVISEALSMQSIDLPLLLRTKPFHHGGTPVLGDVVEPVV